MGSERISVSRDGGVAHVELARDGKFNAMDKAMFEAIGDAFRTLGADPAVRAILLSGRGRHFTAGLDLQYAASQFPPTDDPGRAAEARLRHIKWLQDAFTAAEEARPPVIAAIHGGCIGAGVDLATACDIRLAAADAFFQVAEVDVAITADLGTLQRLTHLIPEGVVRELAYTGRRMAAEEAARLGLVNRVLPDRDAADRRRDGARPNHRRQVAARRRRRQDEPQLQPRPNGRGGASPCRPVECRGAGQRRSHRRGAGAAEQAGPGVQGPRPVTHRHFVG